MTKLLSDEQAQEIFKSEHCNISKDLAGILYRAIEAAVLEAQKQEPWPFSADRVTYHKAAPVVQPDMVMVPREAPIEFADWVCREIPSGTVISDPHWWIPRMYRAMIAAAAEGKK